MVRKREFVLPAVANGLSTRLADIAKAVASVASLSKAAASKAPDTELEAFWRYITSADNSITDLTNKVAEIEF